MNADRNGALSVASVPAASTARTPPPIPQRPGEPPTDARTPYIRPALERLGSWSARTLQMSIPIGPG